jgi:hypothetical protein
MLEDRDLFDKILTFLANILRVKKYYNQTSELEGPTLYKDTINKKYVEKQSGPTYPPPSNLGHSDRQTDIMSMGVSRNNKSEEIKDRKSEVFKIDIDKNENLKNHPY